MNKISKPQFKFSAFEKTATIFGTILSIFTWLFSSWYFAIIAFLVIFLLVLTYLIYKYKKDVDILYENYLSTFNNHQALSKQFDKKSKIIKNKDAALDSYKFTLQKILYSISTGILPVNEYEKRFLKNLYDITLKDIEHLDKLEGGLKNGEDI